MSFKEYLIESEKADAPLHIGHLVHAGDFHESPGGAQSHIDALHVGHNHIVNGTHDSSLTTKVDGGVSVLTGTHPNTHKPFVAYKGAIGKIGTSDETGVCHSHADVDKHFKDKPYLKDKMHAVLAHAHKVLPASGIFQGDLLHAGETDSVKHENGKVSVAPNLIKYSAKENSSEGKKLSKSKIGIAFHTRYDADEHGNLHAKPVDHSQFKQHDDVYNMSTNNDTSRAHYSAGDQAKFKNHMADAEKIHKAHGDTVAAAVSPISAHVSTYINKSVGEGTTPTTEGLKAHVHAKLDKEVDKVKTDVAKARKTAARDAATSHVDTHKEHLDNFFKLHHHLEQAKNVLVKTLDHADHPMEHTIDGAKSHPEGYVHYHEGAPLKLVNKAEFSKKNRNKVRD